MAYSGSATKTLTAQLRLRGGVEALALTGDLTITSKHSNLLGIDPGGADRTVTLPVETDDGAVFWIRNTADGAEALVIEDAAEGAVVTLFRGDSAVLGCDADGWVIAGLHRAEMHIPDPGDAGAIPVTASGVCALVSEAGGETRTLAAPTYMGQWIALVMDTDGSDIVLTAAAAINQTGNTVVTFDAVGEYIELRAVTVADALVWRVSGIDGATASTP